MGRKKVLITGSAGRIGEVLHQGLRECYDLRLMYHRTVREVADDEEVVRGSVADLDAMAAAVAGVDAVVHLAGDPAVSATWGIGPRKESSKACTAPMRPAETQASSGSSLPAPIT